MTLRSASALSDGYRGGVGYNPFRRRVARSSDVWFVAVAVAAVLLVLAWAMFGF